MQHLDTITLRHTLPRVFAEADGSGAQPSVASSEVWMRDVTFSRGDIYLIKAESGTGKSSLCSYIYGDRHDYTGEILFNGEDISRYSIGRWCELRRRTLAYLPQEMRLFPELTALENVDIKNRLTGHRSRREIVAMLEELELGERINYRADRLSVGQQQRVAIVRALCQPFDFLLIDEPVSHLDSRNNAAVAAMITREAKANGAAIIATSVGNDIALPVTTTLHL